VGGRKRVLVVKRSDEIWRGGRPGAERPGTEAKSFGGAVVSKEKREKAKGGGNEGPTWKREKVPKNNLGRYPMRRNRIERKC